MSRVRAPSGLRQQVEARAHGLCEYCRSPSQIATHAFSLEHIIPRDQGSTDELDNLALACQGCNNHKYIKTRARDPVSKRLVPLFHPRRQTWAEHFAWHDDGIHLIGLTATGRATVEALQLNRERLLNLRRFLAANNWPLPQ